MYKIKASEVTSKAAVFRIAAEVIGDDMLRNPRARDYSYRIGCCSAFNQVYNAVWHNHNIGWKLKQRRISIVNRAQEEFEALFRSWGASGYWMGKARNNTQQKRRITALLSAAEVV